MKLTDEEILKACDSTKWIAPEGLALDIGRAIEAAVLAQGDMSPASTHGKNVSMKRGFENMKQEPVDSNEKAGAYMEARLWEFIDMAAAWPQAKPDSRIWDHVLVYAPAAKQEPVAQGEPCGWFDPQAGDYSRVNRLGWSALYLHPAPVNQQLLEALKQAKDAIAEWGSYASEYFQKKHDLQGDLDAVQEAITAARAAIAAAEGKL